MFITGFPRGPLTLLPLATILLPTGVGEGTFCQGHGDSLQKDENCRTQAEENQGHKMAGGKACKATL